jgi:hypothetical protein
MTSDLETGLRSSNTTAGQSEGYQVPGQGLQSRGVSERDRPLEGVATWPNQTKGAISEPGLGGFTSTPRRRVRTRGLPREGTPAQKSEQ